MPRLRSWLALAIAPVLAACSLLYKSDLDDARRPVASSSVVSEAGTDAGFDAGTDAALVTPTGCASYPGVNFCDDFDTQPNLADGWDKLVVNDTTKARFDTQLAFSAPRSFQVDYDDSPSCSYVRLEKTWNDIGTKRVTVSFRVRPTGPWTRSSVLSMLGVGGPTDSSACGLLLTLGEDSPTVSAGVNAQHFDGTTLFDDNRDIDGAPLPNEWTDTTLDAVAAEGHIKLTVTFDHASGTRDTKTLDLPHCVLTGKLFFGLGFHCSQDTHEARYDDVRVSWQ